MAIRTYHMKATVCVCVCVCVSCHFCSKFRTVRQTSSLRKFLLFISEEGTKEREKIKESKKEKSWKKGRRGDRKKEEEMKDMERGIKKT